MFVPNIVIFEKTALDYKLGQQLYHDFKHKPNIKMIESKSNRISTLIPGENQHEKYRAGKKILVVGVKKSLNFQTCKPSAHYQLPLVSGCMGQCEYCYLNTQLGDKPFVRIHVNLEEILTQTDKYIRERSPEITIFEAAATSDPIPVEAYTHALRECITCFGQKEYGRLRFVTKYHNIDDLLNLSHNGHTTIRISLNTQRVIEAYEHFTPPIHLRIQAAVKLAQKAYPIGFIIAPVFLYQGWQEEYKQLLQSLKNALLPVLNPNITFEVISHRFTTKAKNNILAIFPDTTLPMDEEKRQFKYGQFGYGKYMYTSEQLKEMKTFFKEQLETLFPDQTIQYMI